MEKISNIEKLQEEFRRNLERLKEDISINKRYDEIPQEYFDRIKLITEEIEREIQTLFKRTEKIREEIEEFTQFIGDSAYKEHKITNEKSLLMIERDELRDNLSFMIKRLASKIALLKSPVFGVIEVEIDKKTKTYFISKASILDENKRFLSVDWRSPIASIYYQDIGENSEVEFSVEGNKIKAKLKAKYNILFRDSELKSFNDLLDDQYNIKETLSKDLAIRKGGKFKDIINSIQADQDKIIRKPPNTAISIQGCAGSGKTSIAIHRLSKLFYDIGDETMSPEDTVYITPNALFSDYLEDIKVSLGLEGVNFVTYFMWASDILFNKTKPLGESVNIHTKLITSEKSFHLDIEAIEEFIYDYYREILSKYCKAIVAQLRFDIFDYEEVERLLKILKGDFNIADAVKKLQIILKEAEGIRQELIDRGNTVLQNFEIFVAYKKLCEKYDLESGYHCNISAKESTTTNLTVTFSENDVPYLLLIRNIVYGRGDVLNHLMVIDEAQNYTSENISSMLNYVHKNSYMVIGDIHQQTVSEGIKDLTFENPDIAAFSNKENRFSTIVRSSYRTTEKIMKKSYEPFGDALNTKLSAEKFYREGEKVAVFSKIKAVDALKKVIKEAKKNDHDTIAVVSDLKKLIELKGSIDREEFEGYELLPVGDNNYRKGVFFLEEDTLSGLEFEVVLYIGDLKEIEEFRTWQRACQLHVIMSRAMHRLFLYDWENGKKKSGAD